jgi:hypothetical protein
VEEKNKMGALRNTIITSAIAGGLSFGAGYCFKQVHEYNQSDNATKLSSYEAVRAYSLCREINDAARMSQCPKEDYIKLKTEYDSLITNPEVSEKVKKRFDFKNKNAGKDIIFIFGGILSVVGGLISTCFFMENLKDYMDERRKKYSAKPAGLTIPAEKEKPASELEAKVSTPAQTSQTPKKITNPWDINIPQIKNQVYSSEGEK